MKGTGHPPVREYFPKYVPYGLRELMTASSYTDILRWMTVVLERSPDALDLPERSGFIYWCESLAKEVSAGWQAVSRLLAADPERFKLVSEDVENVVALRAQLDPSGSWNQRSARQWADVFDEVTATAKSMLAHEAEA